MAESRKRPATNTSSFSKWTPQYFEDTFGFEFDLNLVNVLSLSREEMSQEIIDNISKHFCRAIEARGVVTSLNETSKCDLISHLFDELVYRYRTEQDRSIRFRREHFFGDEYSSGYVEFVISKHRYLFLVVEAKKDDIFQGLLQNAIELHQASKQNPDDITVYGAVTTLDNWIFTSYTPNKGSEDSMKNWAISKQMIFTPISSEQTSIDAWKPLIKELTEILYGVIKIAVSQIKE